MAVREPQCGARRATPPHCPMTGRCIPSSGLGPGPGTGACCISKTTPTASLPPTSLRTSQPTSPVSPTPELLPELASSFAALTLSDPVFSQPVIHHERPSSTAAILGEAQDPVQHRWWCQWTSRHPRQCWQPPPPTCGTTTTTHHHSVYRPRQKFSDCLFRSNFRATMRSLL